MLRIKRIIEVLERIGSGDAMGLLRDITGQASFGDGMREAHRALQRLEKNATNDALVHDLAQ